MELYIGVSAVLCIIALVFSITWLVDDFRISYPRGFRDWLSFALVISLPFLAWLWPLLLALAALAVVAAPFVALFALYKAWRSWLAER